MLAIDMKVMLVKDFRANGLSTDCEEFCPLWVQQDDAAVPLNCRFRTGLLGRDILRATGWCFVANPVKREAYVVKHDDPWILPNQGDEGRGARKARRPRP